MHFTDAKLTNCALRCFLIVEMIYRNTFSAIEVFIETYLGKLCLEAGNHQGSIAYLRKGWNALSKKVTEEKYNQFAKNFEKIVVCFESGGAGLHLEKEGIHINFPIVSAVDLSTEDEYVPEKLPRLNSSNNKPVDIPVSETWAGMGSEFLGGDNISRNTYAPDYRKL